MKSKVGRPEKPKTFKPSLRCRVDHWKLLQAKYPKQVNKMFNEWVKSLI